MGQITSNSKEGSGNSAGRMLEWKDSPLLYISGPMTSEGHPYANIGIAVKAASWARKLGWAVLIPQLNALAEMITSDDNTINILNNDFNLLIRCDAVLVLPYTKEHTDTGAFTGVAQELNLAELLDIPIYTPGTLPTGPEFDTRCEVA